MSKQVYKFDDIRSKILHAVDTLVDPVRGTISPKGRNVVYEDEEHALFSTNDGVTIARSISVSDPVENAIIEILKGSALKTNSEVGDGTSTSLLLTQVLMHEAFKLIDAGWNPMDLKKALEKFRDLTVAKLKKLAVKVHSDEEVERIAHISANNDPEIAKNVVRVVKTAGLDGMVFIEGNNSLETELVEETGFQINGGILGPELVNQKGRVISVYQQVPVLVTDKKLYYPEEAETILKTVLDNGYKAVVIVARDFIGQAVNTFIANHTRGVINVLLVKDNNVTDSSSDSLHDLAAYLDTTVVSEKSGRIVDNLTIDDFVMAEKVFSDPVKTIVTSCKPDNKKLKNLVAAVRSELKKDKDNQSVKKRLASLTDGMVTIKIGGATPLEVKEKIFRYEDAVSAARAAVRDGYLVGGGLALMGTFNDKEHNPELVSMYRKFCAANVRQIAENCGEHAPSILGQVNPAKNLGYNAATGQIEDLLKVGVIDPYKVTEMAVINSVSIVSQIIHSDYLIIDEEEDKKD